MTPLKYAISKNIHAVKSKILSNLSNPFNFRFAFPSLFYSVTWQISIVRKFIVDFESGKICDESTRNQVNISALKGKLWSKKAKLR